MTVLNLVIKEEVKDEDDGYLNNYNVVQENMINTSRF